jgi:transcriptional antiterminator RfaH
MIYDGQRWYVVQSQPNAENKAVAHLNRQGFRTYLPRYLKQRRHARRIDIVPAPLFPNYLFVAIDITAQRWRSISSTVGVSHIVGSGDHPTAIPAHVVTTLQACVSTNGRVFARAKKSGCWTALSPTVWVSTRA